VAAQDSSADHVTATTVLVVQLTTEPQVVVELLVLVALVVLDPTDAAEYVLYTN
jgi:hypothetical protein